MTREDRRITFRLVAAMLFAVGVLWASGEIVLRLNPPTDLDKRCLNKPIAELAVCASQK